jgi:hypothetical protein
MPDLPTSTDPIEILKFLLKKYPDQNHHRYSVIAHQFVLLCKEERLARESQGVKLSKDSVEMEGFLRNMLHVSGYDYDDIPGPNANVINFKTAARRLIRRRESSEYEC